MYKILVNLYKDEYDSDELKPKVENWISTLYSLDYLNML